MIANMSHMVSRGNAKVFLNRTGGCAPKLTLIDMDRRILAHLYSARVFTTCGYLGTCCGTMHAKDDLIYSFVFVGYLDEANAHPAC